MGTTNGHRGSFFSCLYDNLLTLHNTVFHAATTRDFNTAAISGLAAMP